jgi:hypothetical protein
MDPEATLPRATVAAEPKIRTFALFALFALGACLVSGCSSGKSAARPEPSQPRPRNPLGTIVALHRGGGILGQRGYSIGPIAASSRYVFWTAAAGDEADDVLLLRRDLRTGSNRVMAHRLFPAFGLGMAAGSVVYATSSGTGAHLDSMAVSGGPAHVLSRSLGAPFDARGDMVAWADADQTHNRVTVRNVRTARDTVAFEAARCRGTRCYRIDRVTVADGGIVFDLGSVGQGYASLIVRRSWTASRPSFARVPRDPQPDLASSSNGALYYHLGHGWMQWDFDQPHPSRTWPHGIRPWVLARDGTRELLIGGTNCARTVAVKTGGGEPVAVPPPRSTAVTPRGYGPVCRQLSGYAWSGNRLLLGWSLTPRVSLEAHEEIGVASVVTAADVR